MSAKKTLSVLISSLERATETSNEEWELLTNTLEFGGHWDLESTSKVLSLMRGSETLDVCSLHFLNRVIHHCSVEELQQKCQKGVNYLAQQLQKSSDVNHLQSACTCVSTLLNRYHSIQKGTSDFASRQLPAIISSLIWFTASDTHLQCVVLPLLAKCMVYYPKPCGQFKGQLTKWINTGLFSFDQRVSQECSRLLALVHRHSVADSLVTELHIILSTLYGQDIQTKSHVQVVDIPSIPGDEPRRTAILLRVVCVLSRTLCYSFLMTPGGQIPLNKILGVLLGGLELKQQQVTGISYDKLLLHSMIPNVHCSLWNVLTTLISSCHSHLLPYTTVIESSIAQGLTLDMNSESLVLSIHHCLRAWLSMRRDADDYLITVATSSLLKIANCSSDSFSATPMSTQLSSLNTLATMVKTVGAFFPPPVCNQILQLALKGVTLSTPPQLILCVLDLLLACMTSSNNYLHTNTSGGLGVLSIGTQHQDAKVREFCENALTQCELIRHPIGPPLLSPYTNHETTGLLSVQARTSSKHAINMSQTLRPLSQEVTHDLEISIRCTEQALPITAEDSTPMDTSISQLRDTAENVTSTQDDVLTIPGPSVAVSTEPLHTDPKDSTVDSSVMNLGPDIRQHNVLVSDESPSGAKVHRISVSSDDSTTEDLKLFIAVPPDDSTEDEP